MSSILELIVLLPCTLLNTPCCRRTAFVCCVAFLLMLCGLTRACFMLVVFRLLHVHVVMIIRTPITSFGLVPELRELQSKHNCLFSLRSTCGPWPSCLELCGLVPTNLVVPGFTRTPVAALVQSYLLDVVRRSWELGWPKDEHSNSLVPDALHAT